MKKIFKNIYKKIFVDKDLIYIIIFVSLIVIILITLLFLWKRPFFMWDSPINESLMGTLGDFIGGVIGSAWALLGVILFYLALKEQRADSKTNRKALNKQIEALEMQTREFVLQKEELILSRNVFKEQAKTLKKQQFESTFFAMLQLYNHNIENIGSDTSSENEESFKGFSKELFNNMEVDIDPFKNHEQAINVYKDLFYKKKTEISHYFRIVYRIMRFIELSSMTEEEKKSYSKIIRSQFSEKELLILYYNSHFIFGRKFIPLALKYKLFKHLPDDTKVEFKDFYTKDVNFGFNRLIFLNEVKSLIKEFISEVKEDFSNLAFPITRSFENKDAGLINRVELLNDNLNEMKVSFLEIDIEKFEKYFGLKLNKAINYFNHHFHHIFIFSTYVDFEALEYKLESYLEENEMIFTIKNLNQFQL